MLAPLLIGFAPLFVWWKMGVCNMGVWDDGVCNTPLPITVCGMGLCNTPLHFKGHFLPSFSIPEIVQDLIHRDFVRLEGVQSVNLIFELQRVNLHLLTLV